MVPSSLAMVPAIHSAGGHIGIFNKGGERVQTATVRGVQRGKGERGQPAKCECVQPAKSDSRPTETRPYVGHLTGADSAIEQGCSQGNPWLQMAWRGGIGTDVCDTRYMVSCKDERYQISSGIYSGEHIRV